MGPAERAKELAQLLYKSKLCPSFQRGDCEKGDKCNFAHGSAELRKTVLCKNWEQHGSCKSGDQCAFAHGAEQLTGTSTQGSEQLTGTSTQNWRSSASGVTAGTST